LLSLTVGSAFIDSDNIPKIASYTGNEKIFNIYQKPNIYDFGNDLNQISTSDLTLWTIDENGFIDTGANGSSFAAPLVARKCAYLKSKYNLSIQTIKAYINLQKEINLKRNIPPIANINIEEMENSQSCIIFYDGFIKPKQTKIEKILLPFEFINGKKCRDFHYAISVSYSVNNFLNVGDEYSSLEISAKIMGSPEKGSRKNFLKLEKTSNNEEQTQTSLIRNFKKYNPNKVLIDKDLDEEKYKETYNILDDSIYVEINCNDLFDNLDKDIEYGLVIYLNGMKEETIKNFEKMNQKLIEKIYIELQEEERVRQKIKV